MDVDFDVEKVETFRQAWKHMRDNFYDPGMHGADWIAVRAALEPQIEGARTPDEMRRLINLMLASSTGRTWASPRRRRVRVRPPSAAGPAFRPRRI